MSNLREWLLRRLAGRDVVILNAVVVTDRAGRVVVGSRFAGAHMLLDAMMPADSRALMAGFDGPIPMVEAGR